MNASVTASNILQRQVQDVRLSDELIAWMDQVTADGGTLPPTSTTSAINRLLNTPLETGSFLSRMKTGYFFHFGDSLTWRRNIKNPATYRLTINGTLTFTNGKGVKSQGSGSFIVQPFKTDEYVGIESDLTVIQYVSEDSTTFGNFTSHGVRKRSDINSTLSLHPFLTSVAGQVNNHSVTPIPSLGTSHKGLYIHLNNGTHSIIWRDGVKTMTEQIPDVPNLSNDRAILANNNRASNGAALGATTYTVAPLAFDFLFDRFSDADALAAINALNRYRLACSL